MPDRAALRVLDAWTDRLEPAEEALARARWDAATDATDDHRRAVEAAAKTVEARAHDDAGYAKIEQSLHERIDDPVLRRALERLRLRLLPHRVPRPERLIALEAEVLERFARHRGAVDGVRLDGNQTREILAESRDAARVEAAWRAAVGVGTEVEDAVRETTRLRNEHARALGFADHRRLRLELEEVVPAALDAFLADLDRATEAPWRERHARLDRDRAARFGIALDRLAPWHQGDVFLQSLPAADGVDDPLAALDPVALARATFDGLGFDVSAVLERSDLQPREGKHPHAFCLHVDRAGDVRVLANLEPGARSTRTLLHELGHAVYELGLDPDLPWILRRPPHAATTEGVAMLFGRLVEDEAWRHDVAGLGADPDAAIRRRDDLLCFARWGLAVSRFEERLYADPEQDLDAAWWDCLERYQGVRRPEDPPRGAWASKIHVSCWPVYYHSYLYGETVASMLDHHVRHDVFGRRLVGNPPAGAFLRERVFRPGASVRWERLVEEATLARVDPAALARDVTSPAPRA